MSTKQKTHPKVSPLCSLMALALVVVLGFFAEASAQWTTTGNDITNSNSGNVGVGKSSPTHKLDVLSSIAAIARFDSSAAANTQVLINSASGFNANLVLTRAGVAKWSIGNIAANDRISFLNSSSAEVFSVLQNGNVGINTASPGEKFVTVGNILGGNITSHTQLYSTYDSQAPVIMELGYGTATADTVPYASLVLSKNLTGTAHLVGVLAFANSNIANGNEKRLTNIATWTEGAINSGALGFGTTLSGTIAERMRISSSGKVGIGTTTPTAYMHVMTPSGEFEALRLQRDGNSNGWGVAQLFALKNSSGSLTDYAQVSGGITSNTAGAENGVLAFYVRNAGTLTERMRLTNTGSVGIGTPTPGFRLDVQGGSINSSGGLCIAGDCKTAWSQVGGSQWTTSGSTINYSTGNVGIGVASPGTKLDVNGTVNATALTVSGSPVVSSQWGTSGSTINYSTGNVGIGVASPGTKLDVNGTVNATALTVSGSPVVSSQWGTSGSTINYSTGNVGIGVASPGTKLDVNGTVNATALTVSGSPVVSSQWATSGATINYATGNVGIATASPTEKLHVTGNVKITGDIDVSGNIKAKYQDLAEWVESSQELSSGTVVILDDSKSNQVIASTHAYDSKVAGVISLKPGLELGERGEGRVLVATTGRVKVKVDATNGPIQIGDLLVSSDREGFAMKSMPVDIGGVRIHRPGTLIGKALEPLAGGTGEILVLLSMQ